MPSVRPGQLWDRKPKIRISPDDCFMLVLFVSDDPYLEINQVICYDHQLRRERSILEVTLRDHYDLLEDAIND